MLVSYSVLQICFSLGLGFLIISIIDFLLFLLLLFLLLFLERVSNNSCRENSLMNKCFFSIENERVHRKSTVSFFLPSAFVSQVREYNNIYLLIVIYVLIFTEKKKRQFKCSTINIINKLIIFQRHILFCVRVRLFSVLW